MRRGTWLAAPVIAIAVLACGDSFQPQDFELATGARVQIRVPAGPFTPGAVVPISVRNQGGDTYIWNPCYRSLQQRVAGRWLPVDEGERVCTDEAWILVSGDRTDAETDLAPSLEAGEYRFLYQFRRELGARSVGRYQVSNSFLVGR